MNSIVQPNLYTQGAKHSNPIVFTIIQPRLMITFIQNIQLHNMWAHSVYFPNSASWSPYNFMGLHTNHDITYMILQSIIWHAKGVHLLITRWGTLIMIGKLALN